METYLIIPQLNHVLQTHVGGVCRARDKSCILADSGIHIAGSLTGRLRVMSVLTLICPAIKLAQSVDLTIYLVREKRQHTFVLQQQDQHSIASLQ